LIDFTQRKFWKEKKEMRSLNTQGKSEHKENELKSIKILYISKIGLQTDPNSLAQVRC